MPGLARFLSHLDARLHLDDPKWVCRRMLKMNLICWAPIIASIAWARIRRSYVL